MLADFKDKVIADLGCGYGSNSIPLASQAKQIYSIDLTYERIKFLANVLQKRRIKNITPIFGSINEIPFKNHSIDAFIIVGVLEHSAFFHFQGNGRQKQVQFLKYLRNFLKRNGEIWIGIENQFSFSHFLRYTSHGEIPFTPLFPKPLAEFLHMVIRRKKMDTHLWSKKGLKDLLTLSGYRDIQTYYAYPDYKNPSFIFSSSNGRIIYQYLSKQKQTRTIKILKLIMLFRLSTWFFPCFFVSAKK
jgi:SAM-dependent methyltransferase